MIQKEGQRRETSPGEDDALGFRFPLAPLLVLRGEEGTVVVGVGRALRGEAIVGSHPDAQSLLHRTNWKTDGPV